MNLKLVSSIIILIIITFSALTLNGVKCTSFDNAIPFPFDQINAGIRIRSPVSNETYAESTILLSVTVYLGGTEWVPNSHIIPYENISCVYSLDNGEWENVPLSSIIKKDPWQSIPNKWWFNQMEANYTVVLQDLSEGSHFIRVAVKPDSVRSSNYYASGLEPSVNFTINKQSPTTITSSSPMQPAEPLTPELNYAMAVGVSAITVIAVIAVVLKKRFTQ